MIGRTFGIVGGALRRYWFLVAVAILASIVLGTVQTMKSQFESAVLQLTTDVINGKGMDEGEQKPSFHSVMFEQRAGGWIEEAGKSDISERLSAALLRDLPLVWVIVTYGVIAVIGFLITVAAAAARARIVRDVYVRLRGAALDRALLTDPAQLRTLPNVPGQYATAVQQGAQNVSDGYESLLQIGEYCFTLATVVWFIAHKDWHF